MGRVFLMPLSIALNLKLPWVLLQSMEFTTTLSVHLSLAQSYSTQKLILALSLADGTKKQLWTDFKSFSPLCFVMVLLSRLTSSTLANIFDLN
jgi:hypothetical protein